MSRIGIFGGSFDPIHFGHLLLAELCRESLGLDSVRFVVAKVSPLKTDRQLASDRDRVEMVKIAIGGNSQFVLDTQEIDRGGVSYTIDTAQAIALENPGAKLFLLMGADVLLDIAKWREPRKLFQVVTPCVIARGGVGEPRWDLLEPFVDPPMLGDIQAAKVIAPQVEISSTDIKQRIRNHQSIRYQVPAGVEAYIREHSLYGN